MPRVLVESALGNADQNFYSGQTGKIRMGRMRSGLGRPEALRERQEFLRSDRKLIAKR